MPWPPRFCSECGSALRAGACMGEQRTCAACGTTHYRNAKPCAGALITRGNQVLLARRGIEPRLGAWDIVGGFVLPHEHPSDAARREALEETGLTVEVGPLIAVYVDRYGDGEASDHTLNLYYLAAAPDGEARAASDVAELRWFAADALPAAMAFPHESRVLADWRRYIGGEAHLS